MADESSIFSIDEYKENFKKNKKSAKKEEKVQLQVCDYIRLKYPNVIFTCDLASGLKLPIWLGALHKKMRSSRGLPDLLIAHPKFILDYHGPANFEKPYNRQIYNGLFIELKKDGTTVKLKNGELPANEHIREQAAILDRLRTLGYKAEFACGFEEAIKIIDEYLQ